jgi:anti-sigma regulatory factor (Ser/Thr protein kinase)
MIAMRSFAAEYEQVPRVRRWLRTELGPDHPLTDEAALLLSEAFTNGVIHGTAPCSEATVDVQVETADHLVYVEVIDPGFGGKPDRRGQAVDGPITESGRGLELIDKIARDWGWADLPDGRKKVYFLLGSAPPYGASVASALTGTGGRTGPGAR